MLIPTVWKLILYPLFVVVMVILLIVFHLTFIANLKPQLDNAINQSDTGTPAGNAFAPHSILVGYENVGLIFFGLVTLGMVGDLILCIKRDYVDDRVNQNYVNPYQQQR